MNRVLRALATGIGIGVGLYLVIWGVASWTGVSEDLFGLFALVCAGVGSIIVVELDWRARNRSRPQH